MPRRRISTPAHLYQKSEILYFRASFSEKLRAIAKRSEFRVSLQTRSLRVARQMAPRLYSLFLSLSTQLENSMIDYFELKKRMNEFLRHMVKNYDEAEARKFCDDDDKQYFYRDKPQAMVDYMHSSIRSREYEKHSDEIAHGMMRQGYFRYDQLDGKSNVLIAQEISKAHLLFYTILQKRLEGNYTFEDEYMLKESNINPFTPINSSYKICVDNNSENIATEQVSTCAVQNLENNVQIAFPYNNVAVKNFDYKISACIDYYLELKVSDKDVEEHSVPTHRGRLAYLIEYFHDDDIRKIGRDEMRAFRDILKLMPANRTKIARYKSLSMLQLAKQQHDRVLSPTTANQMLETISSMFRLLIREKKLVENPAVGLSQTDKGQEVEEKDPFPLDDLLKIFHSKMYSRQKYKNSAYFWLPLLSLFTGARREEVAQLYIDDVRLDEASGLYIIDINEKPSPSGQTDKHLKNSSAARIIPLHSVLVELGFIKYVNYIAQNGHERVFPLLKKGRSKQYGKEPGKRFKGLLESHKIIGKKSYHSLRHTLADFVKQNLSFTETENFIYNYVFGHEISPMAYRRYGSQFKPQVVYDTVISRLDYKVDLSHLRNSKYIQSL